MSENLKAVDYIRKGWTQNGYAKTIGGHTVYGDDALAVCWCPLGAIQAAYKDDLDRQMARDKIRSFIAPDNIVDWNDAPGRTQEEVISLCERAGI